MKPTWNDTTDLVNETVPVALNQGQPQVVTPGMQAIGNAPVQEAVPTWDDTAEITSESAPTWEDTSEVEEYSEFESGTRGALQGATFGLADEGYAALAQTYESLTSGNFDNFKAGYTKLRDQYRQEDVDAMMANPKSFLAGEVAGAIAVPLPGAMAVKGAASAAKYGAKVGAIRGLGTSEADLTEGDIFEAAKDVAVGGTIGAATGGTLASKPVAAIAKKTGEAVTKAGQVIADPIKKVIEKLPTSPTAAILKTTKTGGEKIGAVYPKEIKRVLKFAEKKYGKDSSQYKNTVKEAMKVVERKTPEYDKTFNEWVKGLVPKSVREAEGIQGKAMAAGKLALEHPKTAMAGATGMLIMPKTTIAVLGANFVIKPLAKKGIKKIVDTYGPQKVAMMGRGINTLAIDGYKDLFSGDEMEDGVIHAHLLKTDPKYRKTVKEELKNNNMGSSLLFNNSK